MRQRICNPPRPVSSSAPSQSSVASQRRTTYEPQCPRVAFGTPRSLAQPPRAQGFSWRAVAAPALWLAHWHSRAAMLIGSWCHASRSESRLAQATPRPRHGLGLVLLQPSYRGPWNLPYLQLALAVTLNIDTTHAHPHTHPPSAPPCAHTVLAARPRHTLS